MLNIFSSFKRKTIPVVNWTFFSTLKEGKELYNAKTWTGWNEQKWIPIASNDLGDAIIINNDFIYEVQHDTGETKPSLITKEVDKLIVLFKDLIKFKGYSEEDSIEILTNKKQLLKDLKKQAPRSLKYEFQMEIEDIQDAISEKRWFKTKAGQYQREHQEYLKLVYPELHDNGRFADVMIMRHLKRKVFIVGGWLKDDEYVDDVKKIVDKYPSPYPIEYGEFKPYDED